MKWPNLLTSAVIMFWIQSCSSLEHSQEVSSSTLAKTSNSELVQIAPDIPINKDEAFFPLRRREDGKILPSYFWKVCKRRVIFCLKWEEKKVFFEDLEWFLSNEYGLTKRRKWRLAWQSRSKLTTGCSNIYKQKHPGIKLKWKFMNQ